MVKKMALGLIASVLGAAGTVNAATADLLPVGTRVSDNKLEWKLEGFLQYDQSLVSEPGLSSDSSYGLKSLRTDILGKLAYGINYRIHVDYSGGTVRLLDGHADLPVTPTWKLRFGKFKSPIGLELLEAPIELVFIDSAYPTYLVPNRDTGALLYGSVGSWDVQLASLAGAADTSSLDKDNDSGRSLIARVIGKPISGLGVLDNAEVGIAFSTETRLGNTTTTQLASYKPAGKSTLYSYATGVYANGTHYRIAPQGTLYSGPLGILWEYVVSGQDVRLGGANATFVHTAWQIATQYYLSGENASHKYVAPKVAYNPEAGTWGGWQAAFRVSGVNFDPASFNGAYATGAKSAVSAVAGLNWIWSDNVKWFLNGENVWTTASSGANRSDFYADLRLQVRY